MTRPKLKRRAAFHRLPCTLVNADKKTVPEVAMHEETEAIKPKKKTIGKLSVTSFTVKIVDSDNPI